MAKFSDLDPESQRHLVALARCLELAIASLVQELPYMESPRVVRMRLVNQTNFEIDQLSFSEIAYLVKKIDEFNDADQS